MVVCLECNKSFISINPNHLKFKHGMNTKEYRDKYPDADLGYVKLIENREKVCLEKYGVKNPSQVDEIKEKKKQTCFKNFGVDYPTQRKETKKSIGYWKKTYPTFCKEEEMRYNPDKPTEEREIQVHCKNSNCENSKEKGGWFTPTRIQWDDRRRALETDRGNDGAYLYCSQHCKDTCPLYGSKGDDPFKESSEQAYRSHIWNDVVLKQDDYTCQICGSKENLHCHHIQPVKLEPEYSLDPDNGIVLCQTCHIKYGHKVGTECSYGNLAKVICQEKLNIECEKKGEMINV